MLLDYNWPDDEGHNTNANMIAKSPTNTLLATDTVNMNLGVL